MKPFLKLVCEDIVARHEKELDKLCLLFPGKRSMVFFREYLSETIKEPVWSPKMWAVSDFFKKQSGLSQPSELTLLFELHKVYCQLKKTAEPFDQFYFWGTMLLNDFDDIDKHLLDASQIYKNLELLKTGEDKTAGLTPEQLEVMSRFWMLQQENKATERSKDFVSIWKILPQLYTNFRENLQKKGYAYEGMAYRLATEKMLAETPTTWMEGGNTLAVIGLGAINPCEKIIYQRLDRQGMLLVYQDYNKEFFAKVKNPNASFFYEINNTIFSKESRIELPSGYKIPEINIIATPDQTSQAQIIGNMLEKQYSQPNSTMHNDKPGVTGIILADEGLLTSVITSLPAPAGNFNITMGYPVKQSGLSGFLQCLQDLHKTQRIMRNGKCLLHHKPVISLLQHPYLQQSPDKNIPLSIVEKIRKQNAYYIPKEDIVCYDLPVLEKIFTDAPASSIKLIDNLRSIMAVIYQTMQDSDETIQPYLPHREFIWQFQLVLNQLSLTLSESEIQPGTAVIWKVIRKYLATLKIAFSGEPLSGIQVMGVLETRSLDFDNLYVVSMNEGIFPKLLSADSFIPLSLRKGFGLPTPEHNEALYAYYFYRMLQRCNRVTFLYHTSSEGMGALGPSRYLLQLKYSDCFDVHEESIAHKVSTNLPNPIIIAKDEAILEKLGQWLFAEDISNNPPPRGKRYFSPTALNMLIDCTLKFYFRYVAGIREPEEISAGFEPAIFGSVLHKAISLLYESFLNTTVYAEHLSAIILDKEKVSVAITRALHEDFLKTNNTQTPINLEILETNGVYHIVKEAIERYIRQIILIDKTYTPFGIRALEQEMYMPVHFNHANGNLGTVLIGGNIDRVDERGGKVHIIDYKTGSKKYNAESIESLFDNNTTNRNGAIFQLMIYGQIYAYNSKSSTVKPGLYFTRALFENSFSFEVSIGKKKEIKIIEDILEHSDDFNSYLNKMLSNLFDPTTPFIQTSNINTCKNCPYVHICQRAV